MRGARLDKIALNESRSTDVRGMRFELTRRNRHYPLKVACLPISPPAYL